LATHIVQDIEARGGLDLVDPGMNAFSRNVLQLMEHVEYRICKGGDDLEDVFRLRYDSYLAVGMIKSDAKRMVEDEFDYTPNVFNYGVYYDGRLVSTVRLHHVTKKFPFSPSVKVFGDVLEPRIANGASYVDPSRFAADKDWSAELRVLPYITLRLALIACHHFKPTACLTAIKEEHSAFYRRVFIAEPIVRGRIYPGLTMPVDLWQAPCPMSPDQGARRFAFFRSTALERRLLFSRSEEDNSGSLTILPSAKYIRHAA
jgi:hypothetical protein